MPFQTAEGVSMHGDGPVLLGVDQLIRPVLCTGTLLTARLALRYKLACNTAGGTHHAFPDSGSGFCIINDIAITAKVLLQEGLVDRVLILDLDVHQVNYKPIRAFWRTCAVLWTPLMMTCLFVRLISVPGTYPGMHGCSGL